MYTKRNQDLDVSQTKGKEATMISANYRTTNSISRMATKAVAPALALVLVLAGCGTSSPGTSDKSQPSPTSTSLVVVAGNTMGSVPADASLFEDVIADAVQTGGTIDVIVADGSPQSALGGPQRNVGSTAANEERRNKENAAITQQVVGAVQAARPDDAEADVLSAISLARRELVQDNAERKVVAVSASGLSTCGLLDFTKEGMLMADPNEVADYYANKGELPDLSGVDLVMYGIGDTCEPQESLSPASINNLRTMWGALLEACGATVTISDAAPSGVIEDELPNVTPVPVPSTDLFEAGQDLPDSVELTEAVVGFLPDTADYREPAQAMAVLKSVADQLKRSPNTTVRVVGSAASLPSDREWALRLSTERADAVATTLTADCGVNSKRVTSLGIGDAEAEGVTRVNDLDQDGVQIPELAVLNRKVTLFFK